MICNTIGILKHFTTLIIHGSNCAEENGVADRICTGVTVFARAAPNYSATATPSFQTV